MFKKAIFISLLIGGITVAADKGPKPGTYYKLGQLGIKKKVVQGTKITLTFKPVDEQFHWCPGAKVQVTKKATIVTFVRCKTSKSCSVDAKAAIGKRLIRTITIDTSNKNTYVRNGAKSFKLLHAAPKKKADKTTPKSSSTPATKTPTRPSVMVTNPFT